MKHQLEVEAMLSSMKFELGEKENAVANPPIWATTEQVLQNLKIGRDRWKYWVEALQWLLGPQDPAHEWTDEDCKCPKCGHQIEFGSLPGAAEAKEGEAAEVGTTGRWFDMKEKMPKAGVWVLLELGNLEAPQVGYYNPTQRCFYAATPGYQRELYPFAWQELQLLTREKQ